MVNRIRIVNNLSICSFIGLCIGLINKEIVIFSSSSGLSFKDILVMIFSSSLPYIIGLSTSIIIIIICNRRYKHKKDDLKIKNNYFFIGTYLLISNIVNFSTIPFSIYWLISMRELIRSENIMRILIPNIATIMFTILSIVIGIFMVVKDTQKKQIDIN